MLNEIEKTDNFLKAISKYAEEQRKRIRQESDFFRDKELQKAEREALKQAYEMIRKEMTSVKNKVAIKVSEKELEAKRNISHRKSKIINGVFRRAKFLIESFTDTYEYKALLEKSLAKISKIIGSGTKFLLVREKDKSFVSSLKETLGEEFTIKISQDIELGGIKAQNFSTRLLIDETLDTKLSSQKEWFLRNCACELSK